MKQHYIKRMSVCFLIIALTIISLSNSITTHAIETNNNTNNETAIIVGENGYDTIEDALKFIIDSDTKNGVIQITKDIAISDCLTIPTGIQVKIISDDTSHQITRKNDKSTFFLVQEGASLTIDGNLTFLVSNTGEGIIKTKGTFTLREGILDFNGNVLEGRSQNTGVVLVCGKKALFNMEGGTIKNAIIDRGLYGGVRVCCGGTFNMENGTICQMDSRKQIESCAVFICSGSDSRGNGPAFFNLNGGTIENNKGCRGAGVFLLGLDYTNRATMTMNGGTIQNNTAYGFTTKANQDFVQGAGAGIYIERNAEVTMNNGTITKNTVDGGEGGGVCAACGWESVAGSPGWNIDLFSKYYPASFTMNGGIISNNTAKMHTTGSDGDNGCGGGVYVASHRVSLNSGKIENNIAEKQGGGVYVGATPYILKIHNAVVKENHATVLGGGLWTCPTGDASFFVNNGAAIYDNTSDGAGDDIASVKLSSKKHSLTLADRVLGGGQVFWHEDGKIKANSILGYPSNSPRYTSNENNKPLNPITNYSESIALKSLLSDGTKAAAINASSLIIRNNQSQRGGGIGSNGGIIVGDEKEYDYTLTVKKTWSNTNENKKTPITLHLKLGDNILNSFELNEANNWTMTFSGLPDPATLAPLTYSIVEDPVPNNFIPVYSQMEIDDDKRAIYLTVDNQYIPPKQYGNLTITKKVTGTGLPNESTEFEFVITKDNVAASGQYSIDGNTAQPIPSEGKIKIKANQSVLLSNLIQGEYTVTETTPTQKNYKSTLFSINGAKAQTGLSTNVTVNSSSNKNSNKEKTENTQTDVSVTFTNIYHSNKENNPPSSDKNIGNLIVSKTVIGNEASKSKSFNFTVHLDDSSINGKYGNITFKDGVAKFLLKHGEKFIAIGLPAGIKYKVTENENKGYIVTSIGDKGIIKKDETIEAAFTNRKNTSTVSLNSSNPSSNQNNNPHTGDSTNEILWPTCLIVSLTILVAIIRKISRQHYNK